MKRWDDENDLRIDAGDSSLGEPEFRHEQPREDPFGRGFEQHEPGRPLERRHEGGYTQPYDRWEPRDYVFYSGEGYHREFIEPYKPPARGPYAGRGPKNSSRSDARIDEDVNERLTLDGDLDATNVGVRVEAGEVTLEGMVTDRRSKRLAEDIALGVRGVRDVQNRLRAGAATSSPAQEPAPAPAKESRAPDGSDASRSGSDAAAAPGGDVRVVGRASHSGTEALPGTGPRGRGRGQRPRAQS